MLAPPKSLLGLGASLLTLRTAQRLRRTGAAPAEQDRARRTLIGSLSRTAYGRAQGLAAGMSYERFRTQVPPRAYPHLEPWIERMKRGEADVLWPGRCEYFATTSGISGAPKHVPVTPAMVRHFRHAGLQALLYYTARVGHAGVFQGHHLLLGGSMALTPSANGGWIGDLSGIAQRHLPPWVQKLSEPTVEIAEMSDWSTRIRAMAERSRHRDVALLAGMPNWLLLLAQAVLEPDGDRRRNAANLHALWPNLECVIHSGIPLGPFGDELRRAVGPEVALHEVYAAAEAVIAARDAEATAGLRLMTGAGIFFEFLPLAEFHEDQLGSLGVKAVPLEGVQTEVDYVLLLTTPAGLCRYMLGDVVRFLSTEPPRLIHVGRTDLRLTASGEQVNERELTDALLAVCQDHHWQIANFHVAPLFAKRTTGKPSRHEWWVELRPGTMDTPTGPAMAKELDAALQRLSSSYREQRRSGGLEAPFLRLVMPGLFDEWLQQAGKWDGNRKTPRCRNDRLVADELARLAPFSAH